MIIRMHCKAISVPRSVCSQRASYIGETCGRREKVIPKGCLASKISENGYIVHCVLIIKRNFHLKCDS